MTFLLIHVALIVNKLQKNQNLSFLLFFLFNLLCMKIFKMSSSSSYTISDIYTVEAFNALIEFSEAELQLLENFKNFFTSRVKIDREYGQNLNKIAKVNKSSVVGASAFEQVKLIR
jgi:hypothetical protein